ncbi:GNAT family N-acetyltransferase [Rouxiella sp. Mn2063]|uniref:GNAT family N-acetyltransferase n=1 Tax=Rouxiella sp. Mn2063 TaxID=3395262 RepID=UPI003BD32917
MEEIHLVPAKKYRNIIENLFPYYVYDLAEYGKWPCTAEGRYSFNPALLDPHWSRDDHWPWLIYCGEELAGFCLLRRYPDNSERYDIDQFFVLRKFKGQGVGKRAFELAVSTMPGLWQTRVLVENSAALHFWRSAIDSLTNGHYQEQVMLDGDLPMHFIYYQVFPIQS